MTVGQAQTDRHRNMHVCLTQTDLSRFRSVPVRLHSHPCVVPSFVELLPALLLQLLFCELVIRNANERERRYLLDFFFFDALLLVARSSDGFLQLCYRLLKLRLRAEAQTL